jgi:hypothetical protein
MHLTGITKRASCLIAVREPAQPVADTHKSEVNRTTAKLPGRNTTAIPPLHAIGSMIPDTSGNRTVSHDDAVVVPKLERIQIIANVCVLSLWSRQSWFINATFCTQEKNDKHDAKNARVTLVTYGVYWEWRLAARV